LSNKRVKLAKLRTTCLDPSASPADGVLFVIRWALKVLRLPTPADHDPHSMISKRAFTAVSQ